MKTTPKQYALALYESLDGKSAGKVKAIIKKFVELLARENMLAKADKIAAEFIKIWNKKNNFIEAEAVTASGLDKAGVKLLKNYVTKLTGAREVLLSEKIDKNILGGVVIRYGDKIVDGSLKTRLEELREKMIK